MECPDLFRFQPRSKKVEALLEDVLAPVKIGLREGSMVERSADIASPFIVEG